MKISVSVKSLKDPSQKGLANVCFRIREKSIDIKVVSEITVNERYWNLDNLTYERNNIVPKDEQRKVEKDIAEIIEKATTGFSNKADSAWLKEIIEEVLHPQLAFERNHPYIIKRLQEYSEKHNGTQGSKNAIKRLERIVNRYHIYRREVDGEKDFKLFVENITLEDLNDFRDYISYEHELRNEYPEIYAGCFTREHKPKELSGTSIINIMNQFCVFLKWCKKMGYTQSEAFLQYGCKTPVYGDPFYLTSEERNILYEADLSENPKLAIIRDIFVFHCYIGCRVGDLYKLTRNNIKDGFLEYMPQKTKKCQAKTVRVPLHDKAIKILESYNIEDFNSIPGVSKPRGRYSKPKTDPNFKDNRLFPFLPIYKYNEGIRELLKHCRIDRKVTVLDTHGYKTVQKPLYEVASSHTARKTFVGNLYKQVPDPNLIASMSGHGEGSRAFKRYRNIDDEMKRKLVEMIN